MSDRRMTDAQRRALEWLPEDGSWRMKPGRLSAALKSLGIYHKDLLEMEAGNFGPRGSWQWRYRRRPT